MVPRKTPASQRPKSGQRDDPSGAITRRRRSIGSRPRASPNPACRARKQNIARLEATSGHSWRAKRSRSTSAWLAGTASERARASFDRARLVGEHDRARGEALLVSPSDAIRARGLRLGRSASTCASAKRRHGARAALVEAKLGELGASELDETLRYERARLLERAGLLAEAREAYVETAERHPYPAGALLGRRPGARSKPRGASGAPARSGIALLERMLAERETSSSGLGSYERARYAEARFRNRRNLPRSPGGSGARSTRAPPRLRGASDEPASRRRALAGSAAGAGDGDPQARAHRSRCITTSLRTRVTRRARECSARRLPAIPATSVTTTSSAPQRPTPADATPRPFVVFFLLLLVFVVVFVFVIDVVVVDVVVGVLARRLPTRRSRPSGRS